ncbi:PoNe immunity protein domain-containing protein [Pseudomonas viridiflava]|uniref:PoNe immunity protein domain-containing protein n=1 Tax=Pseudomonas viridiflava TaxID=33069 RepID=UPI002ECEE8AA|nr:PoNe immunity protein domain-containing protein [Pseudomonas viridiflava]MEE3931793.1 PoNe immunity protein domain-containing protein [Pseudomonas viridiflava]MEE3941695.1 PoNe immunity protein domain-containing protein [Pseudomonas viridiflava]MEE3969161.1 PoNe immunity protein domain-containing protein [Pseudomonas viridiflava]MEE3983571.1 PoNe immunity protein domain-containing protein [Pseudomonas viridiflava]
MNKRQKFYSEKQYLNFQREHNEVINFLKTNTFESDSPQEEAALRSRHLQKLALDRLLAAYTAGEEIASLTPLLEDLIQKYELRQSTLEIYENTPNISPLAIDDWPYQYEECVQVIGFCILLHRVDLLKRFVKLIDRAGYAGDDTLYEDLLTKLLPNRYDVDEWFHEVYSPLVQAIYAESKEEAAQFLKKYCSQWYSAFSQAPWHDLHLQGENGNYVGYWAIEAGAIAFLYNIDDSKIDHMVYPKDLVEYARNYQGANGTQINRVVAGDPCTKTGYWFTPAQANSRRHFQQGEIMPSISDSTWGDTLWYWSGEE